MVVGSRPFMVRKANIRGCNTDRPQKRHGYYLRWASPPLRFQIRRRCFAGDRGQTTVIISVKSGIIALWERGYGISIVLNPSPGFLAAREIPPFPVGEVG